jgi:hypothetical protein
MLKNPAGAARAGFSGNFKVDIAAHRKRPIEPVTPPKAADAREEISCGLSCEV